MKVLFLGAVFGVFGLLVLFAPGASALSDNPSRHFFALYDGRPTLEDLQGKTSLFVQEHLGPPHHIWHETPAQMWQYATPECILNVVFYPRPDEIAAKSVYAEHLSSRAYTGKPLPVSTCLTFIASSRP